MKVTRDFKSHGNSIDLHIIGVCREEKIQFIATLVRRVVEDCSVIAEPLLFKGVPETGDGVYNYGRVFCHHASLALEFKDAWIGIRFAGAGSCLFCTSRPMKGQNMHGQS